MAYTKTDWVSGETPLSAQNMNKMERGIEDAHNDISELNSKTASLEYNLKWVVVGSVLGTEILHLPLSFNEILFEVWTDGASTRFIQKIIGLQFGTGGATSMYVAIGGTPQSEYRGGYIHIVYNDTDKYCNLDSFYRGTTDVSTTTYMKVYYR